MEERTDPTQSRAAVSQGQSESYESKFIAFSDTPGSAPLETVRVQENRFGGVSGLPAPIADRNEMDAEPAATTSV